MYWILEAALEEEIRKRLEQILGAKAEVVTGVSGVPNPLHGTLFLGRG